ncbi:MAG: PH domain-containing protein [Gammaproteobacteria bacterium]|nr:PH domain-containing protein [Gammaproteobacteria bacterium]MYA36295.1 PH domain-containing protein [Gammaproteobacteria bacterium]MYC58729.1 PH domain-containing protein [Gammaproteobacteria bacterium]MYG96361.1 PH domain-containing protein [Gammaproteobacteria bacterium]MYH47935.1 PH domain-containing protein [Gammaproteobacteria bacterium]
MHGQARVSRYLPPLPLTDHGTNHGTPIDGTGSSQGKGGEMLYKSKIDTWLVLIIVGLPLVLLYWIVFAEVSGSVELTIVVAAFGAALLLPVWILAATDYRFRDDSLHIRSGPFKWTIPLDDISRIERSRLMISGPALSLDKLLIHYGSHRYVVISPKDKEGFLSEFESRRKSGST